MVHSHPREPCRAAAVSCLMAEGLDLRRSVLTDFGEKRRLILADLRFIDDMIRTAGGDPADYDIVTESTTPVVTPAPTLAVPAEKAAPSRSRPTKKRKSGLGRYGRSVRLMVVEIVSSEPRWWTTGEIMDHLKEMIGPGRVDDKLADNMRTAVYTSRKAGEFDHDPERGYRLAVKSEPTDTDATEASEINTDSHAVGVSS